MSVQVINRSHHQLPAYATDGASGLDVRANLDESVTLAPLERVLIPTGLFVSIPAGYECQVRPRSGLAAKYGVTVANAPGTIDSDYRGEIKVILVNLSQSPFVINDGERVAQLVFAPYQRIEWAPVANLDETDRGEGGFGHTGVE
ncbi:MAG: dUTP diphosphatase [Muribaculaceae bacterium]|nr:dUTP diphosphatase [Muribaculaceae bacterium]